MDFFGKKPRIREFKLRSHIPKEDEKEEFEEKESGKYVHFEKPDRSNYPRILDLWPLFVVLSAVIILGLIAFKIFMR